MDNNEMEEAMPKRAAFIKWAEELALDVTEDRDVWGRRKFAHSHIQAMWEGWFNAPTKIPAQMGPVHAQAALSETQRGVIVEAAQVLESAAAHNCSKFRTMLAHTQQDRADRLRDILASQQPAAAYKHGYTASTPEEVAEVLDRIVAEQAAAAPAEQAQGQSAQAKRQIPPRDQALCNDGKEPDWAAYAEAEAQHGDGELPPLPKWWSDLEKSDKHFAHQIKNNMEDYARLAIAQSDLNLNAVMAKRDDYHEWADKLAEAIGCYFGESVGEHSSDSLPWETALEIVAQHAGSAKPSEQAEASHKPAVTVDTPELTRWSYNTQRGVFRQAFGDFVLFDDAIAHTARAVAEALEGQLTEMGPRGALYLPQAWPDAWHALRDDVLSGVDGLDNDQINIVLGMLDNYEPVAAIQPSQPAGAVATPDKLANLPWTDQSTADPITKAKRVMAGLIGPTISYFYNDGFPRDAIGIDARNVLAVIEYLTAPPAAVQSTKAVPTDIEVYAEMRKRNPQWSSYQAPRDVAVRLAIDCFRSLFPESAQQAIQVDKPVAQVVRDADGCDDVRWLVDSASGDVQPGDLLYKK